MTNRLYYDRGAKMALLGGGILVVILLGDYVRRNSLATSKGAQLGALSGQAFCNGRAARGAVVTLRPPLARTALRVGHTLQRTRAAPSGTFSVDMPQPVPPDFLAELLIAMPGCLTARLPVVKDPREVSWTMDPVSYAGGPMDVRDPPSSPSFPPPAGEEQIAAVREMGGVAGGDYALFDGPPPVVRAVSRGHRARASPKSRQRSDDVDEGADADRAAAGVTGVRTLSRPGDGDGAAGRAHCVWR